LFQVPSLGGIPTKLAEDVDSPVTLSPDDKHLAFIRYSPSERGIIIANVDGTGERKLASTPQAASFRIGVTGLLPLAWIPPAWSPDGKILACPVTVTGPEGEYQTVWAFQVEDGDGHSLASQRWRTVGRMEWLGDGSGLLVSAADQEANPTQQIWYVAYPGGATRRVTNDLNDYRDLSVTKDGKTLIAVQSERRANIFVATAPDTSHPAQLTFTNYDGLGGLAWAPDGRLVYTLQAGGEQNLWVNDLNGNTKQLTAHAGLNRQPVVSPDGHHIVFVSNRTGLSHIWRMDADGAHPQELTHGAQDSEPDISADGQWVIYRSVVSGRGNIFRVGINGGEPLLVTNGISALPVVSPDGNQVALIYRPASAARNQIAVMPFAGGEPRLIHELPAHYGRFSWMPDGSGVVYADKQSGLGNLWVQPLDGGPPKQLTFWASNPIFSFTWSRDGNRLAFAGGTQTSDLVLIDDVGR
ncbi:MAG TPA: DPP IV N-terminal domain-containing protein, partial [Pyrinomonadaceae bacterium]|nr:DPP IV N-terminal domain-containing protein [Pyrinomonadaceae bacterium]